MGGGGYLDKMFVYLDKLDFSSLTLGTLTLDTVQCNKIIKFLHSAYHKIRR